MNAKPATRKNKEIIAEHPHQTENTAFPRMLYVFSWLHFSIPDVDFSRHPAHLAQSAAKGHQGIVGYSSLRFKNCNIIKTRKDEMHFLNCSAHPTHFLCSSNLCLSQGIANKRLGAPPKSSWRVVIIVWATYLDAVGQSHMSPQGRCASWQTSQAAVFSILISRVAGQCKWTDASEGACTKEELWK